MPLTNDVVAGDTDDSDEVISCEGDTSPVENAHVLRADSSRHRALGASRAPGRRGVFSAILNSKETITSQGLQNENLESNGSSAAPSAAKINGSIPRNVFSAMLNSKETITWQGLQNEHVESNGSSAAPAAAKINGSIPRNVFSAMLNSKETITWQGRQNEPVESNGSSAAPAAAKINGSNPRNGAEAVDSAPPGVHLKQAEAKQLERIDRVAPGHAKEHHVNGLSDVGKSKSIPSSDPLGVQRVPRPRAVPLQSRRSDVSAGTSNVSQDGGVSPTDGRCEDCARRGPGQMGPAGTEYANSFYCNACWSSWGMPGGSANAQASSEIGNPKATSSSNAPGAQLGPRGLAMKTASRDSNQVQRSAPVQSRSPTAFAGTPKVPKAGSGSPTEGRCKECLRRGPGQMGPAGTEYANSFYCNDCWSSWGTPGGVADAAEEFVSSAELEVAALLAWCLPGYSLGTLQSVEGELAEAEFRRFCRVVGDEARAKRVAEELLRLAKGSIPTLRRELKKLGFPSVKGDDAVLEKRLSLARLKDVLTWLELSEHDLAKVCARKQLLNIQKCVTREELVQLLADDAWNDRGIPVDKIQSRDVAFGILEQLEIFEKKSQRELSLFLKGKFAGTSLEGVQFSKQTLVNFVRETMIWKNMTCKQVVEFCLEWDIAVPGVNMQEALESSSIQSGLDQEKLIQRLLEKLGSDFLETQTELVKGITPFKGEREVLLREFRRLEDLSFEQLRQDYQNDWGFPVEPGIDAQQICSAIKTMLVWTKLPTEGLREEVAELAPSFNCSGKTRDELIQQLMVESAAARYKDLGVPVYQIEQMHGSMQVIRDWERLERMTDVMLAREWTLKKFPHNPEEIAPDGVKKCLRAAAVWAQLSSEGLITECNERGISSASPPLPEEERHTQLMESLKKFECSAAYCESKGIPVEKIANIDSAMQLLLLYQKVEKMSNDELIAEYKKFLPVDEYMKVECLLQHVKDIHLWAVLPLAALKDECQKRGVRCKLPEEKRSAALASHKLPQKLASTIGRDEELQSCQLLRDRLLLTLCEPFFKSRSIPAMELGSVKVCQKVSDKFDNFAIMSRKELSEAHLATGLPWPSDAQTKHLLLDLKQFTIWNELPLGELRRVAHQLGVLGTVDAKLKDREAHQELIRRLVAGKQVRQYESHGIPVRRLDSNKTAAVLLETFEVLERMNDSELAQECAKRGFVAPPAHVDRMDKLRRMKWAISTQELPFVELRKECVSSGVRGYHSAAEDRRPEMLQRLLALIWDNGQSKNGRAPYQPPTRGLAASPFAKHFSTLALPTTASLDDVKKAYKKLALKYHPDKQDEQEQDAGAKFLEISTAYEALCNHLSSKTS